MRGLLCLRSSRAQQSQRLNLGGNNRMHQCRLGVDLGVLVDNRLVVSQRCAPSAKNVDGILEYIKECGQQVEGVILPLYSALVRSHLESCSGPLKSRRTENCLRESSTEPQRRLREWSISL